MSKKIEIRQFTHAEVDAPKETFGFLKIPVVHTLIRAEGENLEVSDGYHTMDELYDHRIALWIALCKVYAEVDFAEWGRDCPDVWRSKLHDDGSEYEGWFVLGIGKKKGEIMTYHLPKIKWDDTSFAETLERAPEFDGHTSADVLERLKNL